MAKTKTSYSVSSYFLVPLSLAFLAAMTFLATAFNATILAGSGATALILLLVLRFWGSLGIVRLDVSFSCDGHRLFPGETVTLNAEVSNRKFLPVWIHSDIKIPDGLKPGPGQNASGDAVIPAHGSIKGSWQFRAGKRGLYRIGPLSLVASDPLDLYRKEKLFPFENDLIVYPRIPMIHSPLLPFMEYFGIHPAKGIIEDPAWYEGTREYSGNRPARNIHWKASARLDILQEKIFEPTSHQKVFFIFDGYGFEKAEDEIGFEKALEALAALASQFIESGADVALATDREAIRFSPVLPLGRGPEHLGALLELLARTTMRQGKPLSSLIEAAGTRGASFVVMAREPNKNTRRFFSLPSTRRDRILFVFSEKRDLFEHEAYPSIGLGELFSEGTPS
jgi:uncharacterized protein (DUF58 family)